MRTELKHTSRSHGERHGTAQIVSLSQQLSLVDTTPICTRADAHFSRLHITVHNSLVDPHSFNVVTSALAQGTRDQCRAFLFACSAEGGDTPMVERIGGMHIDLTLFHLQLERFLFCHRVVDIHYDHSAKSFALAHGCHKTDFLVTWSRSAGKRHRKWSQVEGVAE